MRFGAFHEKGSSGSEGALESLFIEDKVMSLRKKAFVYDDNRQLVYRTETNVLSFVDKTVVFDAGDRTIAVITKKFLSLHERHYVDLYDGSHFELSNELFHIVKDVINIPELGWKIEGNVFQLTFRITDSNGRLIAIVGQKVISIRDKYSIDIYEPRYRDYVVCVVIALKHMVADRENASSSGSSGS